MQILIKNKPAHAADVCDNIINRHGQWPSILQGAEYCIRDHITFPSRQGSTDKESESPVLCRLNFSSSRDSKLESVHYLRSNGNSFRRYIMPLFGNFNIATWFQP